jgi:class 3 adenylate cyclase
MSSVMDQGNRTFIGSVVFVDIVGYSKKSVSDQILLKDRFTSLLSDSLKDIAPEQRIILDTGDGAALSFIGDPEDALFVGMNMRDMLKRELAAGSNPDNIDPADTAAIIAGGELSLRIGINLGPIKLVRDINGQPNIVGDGINVAQRIMSFARPGQVVVSRSYFDVVSVISDEYAQLFKYEGSRTDKHVREHEIYVVGESVAAFNKAKSGMEDRAAATNPRNKNGAPSDTTASDSDDELDAPLPLMQDKKKLAIIGGALGCVVIALALMVVTKKPAEAPKDATAITAVATDAAKTKPIESAAATPATPATATPDAASTSATPATAATGAAAVGAAALAAGKAADAVPAKSETAKADTAKADAPKAASKAVDAAKTESAKSSAQANLNFAVAPWGEVIVNGKSIGLTPPLKQHKLPPGKHKIEVRNSTFTPYVVNVDMKSKEELTIRHTFK